MAIQGPLPKAEAKVVVRENEGEWRDALDFDPIYLPIEADGMADVFDNRLMDLIDSIVEADNAPAIEYMLVWANTGHPVKGLCPVCDDVFVVSEGANGDTYNEGHDAVFCGCDPKDSFNG